MPEHPSGTVTFLFTDVQGSTQLLRHLRDRYGAVLAEHQRLLRDAFAAHGGEEVDTQGDAFFYVFTRARDAASAAAAGQRALGAHVWPEGTELLVRMGLHTGEPDLSDDGRYHGLGVHRTQRIMSAGHGGQVLVSQATAAVLSDEELEGISLRDLGDYRLKDLPGPTRIYQLDIEGLVREFSPLKTDAPDATADDLAAARKPIYRRPLVIGAFAGVLAAAVAIPVLALGGGSSGRTLSGLSANSVGVVDAGSGKLVDDVLDVPTPARAAEGEGSIWVTSPDAQLVSRIDPRSRKVQQTIPVGSGPTGVAVGAGDVWVANTLDGTVSRIDPDVNRVVQTIPVGKSPTAVVFGNGSVWVANLDDQTLTRIDGRSGRPVKTTRVDAAARGVAFGGGSVWLSDGARNRVVRVDPGTGEVTQTINVGSGPTAVGFDAGSLWVANSLDGTVSQIDPEANAVRATIPVGSSPNGLAVVGNDVWVSDETGESLVRLDAAKGSVAAKVRLGSQPGGVVPSNGSLFVTAQGSPKAHRGGTLRLRGLSPPGPDTIDAAVAGTPLSTAFLTITNDGLLAFKRVGGGDGTQLVPDLATSLPAPTDGGKSYTFQLRHVRFSNGNLVTPQDVRHSIEREFAIKESPGKGFFGDIKGAAACKKTPKRCDLRRGIVTDPANRTVTFHLTRPNPDFLYKLATVTAEVVPADAPRAESTTPLPATGPYMIKSYDPKSHLRLVRNPRFRVWSAAAKPDGYPDELRWDWPSKANDDAAIDAVEHGRADVAFEAVASSRAAELTTQYASQVHATPVATTPYWVMNTRTRPFNDVRVRRAVNYALDRKELIRRHGGPLTAQPSCQILPPNFPGYRPYCPYTLHPTAAGAWSAPDLAKARALVRASGTRGAKVTLSACTCIRSTASEIKYERTVLEQLGYHVTLHLATEISDFLKQSSHHPQLWRSGWIADYPAASNFFGPPIACDGGANVGNFCDPALDRDVKRATALQQTDPGAAAELWAKLDRHATDQAPWIVGFTPRHIDLVSKRVGNYQHNPIYAVLLDQLWVK